MKRLVIVLALAAAGLGGFGIRHTALAAPGGNSAAAQACLQDGYANLLGTDGFTDQTFTNTGDCASYAAHGGTLVSVSDAAPCLNGGYSSLGTSSTARPFPSEAACVLFIGQGGQPVPVSKTSITGIIWGD